MSQVSLYAVQDSIQELLDDLIPIETTMNTQIISQLDDHMVQACRDLYAFIMRLYTDMRVNPTEYGLLSDDKEACGRALALLHSFVWQRIPDGELMTDSRIWISGFLKNDSHLLGNVKTPFQIQERLNFLQRCGLHIEYEENGAFVANPEYPLMLLPLQKLRQAAKKNYAGSVVYHNCEFRLITNPKYQPTIADIIYNRVSPETEKLLLQLDLYAREKNFKPECRVKECIYYRYKSKRIMTITVRRHLVYILINIGDIDHINGMPYTDDFKTFIKKNMGYCTNCFSHHGGGKKVILFGKQVSVCGHESLKVRNPKPIQLDYITQAIDFGHDALGCV